MAGSLQEVTRRDTWDTSISCLYTKMNHIPSQQHTEHPFWALSRALWHACVLSLTTMTDTESTQKSAFTNGTSYHEGAMWGLHLHLHTLALKHLDSHSSCYNQCICASLECALCFLCHPCYLFFVLATAMIVCALPLAWIVRETMKCAILHKPCLRHDMFAW